MKYEDYYATLGVARNADLDQMLKVNLHCIETPQAQLCSLQSRQD